MNFEIVKVSNGWKVVGHNSWHGSFEYYYKRFSEAMSKVKAMRKTAEKWLS